MQLTSEDRVKLNFFRKNAIGQHFRLIENKIHSNGGLDENYLDSVEIYDPIDKVWHLGKKIC